MADAQSLSVLSQVLTRTRARAQLLAQSKRRTPAEIVRHLLAVQAQDFASVPLALRARSLGLTRADVHAAIDNGEILISWLNRGTLHLVCREDYPWLHALTAPTTVRANQRRLAEEGVEDAARGVARIVKELEDGPLPRAEIGVRAQARGAALTHLLVAATLEGLIVRGPIRGNEQTFVLTRDWIGPLPAVERDEALAQLARRYLTGHSPASEADLAYWSKLPLRDVRAGLMRAGLAADGSGADRRNAGAALEPPESGGPLEPPESGGAIEPRLLPPFDPYILGWKDRSFAIPAKLAERVMPGGGMFRAVVLVDGRVAGTWSRAGGRVVIDAAQPIAGIESEVDDVERFLRA